MRDDTEEGLIARPGQSLHNHLANVASLTAIFADGLGLPTVGRLIGSVHDAGKASSAFQRYIRSATGIYDSEDEERSTVLFNLI
jgi:CRISPR-associated endonuclease/helicase Cas3